MLHAIYDTMSDPISNRGGAYLSTKTRLSVTIGVYIPVTHAKKQDNYLGSISERGFIYFNVKSSK